MYLVSYIISTSNNPGSVWLLSPDLGFYPRVANQGLQSLYSALPRTGGNIYGASSCRQGRVHRHVQFKSTVQKYPARSCWCTNNLLFVFNFNLSVEQTTGERSRSSLPSSCAPSYYRCVCLFCLLVPLGSLLFLSSLLLFWPSFSGVRMYHVHLPGVISFQVMMRDGIPQLVSTVPFAY